MDYKSYSNDNKELGNPKTNINKNKPICKGKVKKKNKFITDIINCLIPGEVTDIKTYLLSDIIVPAIKRTISDTVQMFLYNEVTDRRPNGNSSRISYTNYNSLYNRPENNRIVNRISCDDIELRSLSEAQSILARMNELIHEYGIVSIGDFYDLAGITNVLYTDYDYGWTDIRAARIVPSRGGYVIKMPKASPLRN